MQQLEKQSDSASWHGRLSLTYEKKAHQTQVQQSYHQAPLNLQRPFYPEGPVCHSVMMHTAGGMVGGDRLSINVTLQPQAHVLLTTTSAGKVYRSNGHGAQQTVQCQLDANAILEWLPLGTIVFDQAQFRQTLQVELGPGAIFADGI